MAPTSSMLLQHIGRIENWIDTTVRQNPMYKALRELGLTEKDGVLFKDLETGVSFSPSSVTGNFSILDPVSFQEKFNLYVFLIKELDSNMVTFAVELDDRRAEYEVASIEETIARKGTLWLRNNEGVSKIQVIEVHKMMNFRKLEYYDLSNPKKEKKTQSMRFCRLFLNKKDAYNPMKEGYHDA